MTTNKKLTWLQLMNGDGLIWKFIVFLVFTVAIVIVDIKYETEGWAMAFTLFPTVGALIAIVIGGFWIKWRNYNRNYK